MLQRSSAAGYWPGVLSGQATRVGVVTLGFWLTPFVLRFLEREEYGLFALTASAVAWLGRFDLGASAGLQAHLARLSPDDDRQASRYVSATLYMQLCLAVATLSAGWLAAPVFARFLHLRPERARQAVRLLRWLVCGAALAAMGKTFAAALTARQQMSWVQGARLAAVVLRAGVTVVLLLAGGGVAALAVAYVVSCGASLLLNAYLMRRLFPGVSMWPALDSRPVLRPISSSGFWFALGGVAGLLIVGLDRTVAAKMISLEAVAVLFLTGRLYALAASLLNPIVEMARPGLGRLLSQQRHRECGLLQQRLATASTGLGMAAAASIWAGNRAFVVAWVGAENYGGWALDAALAAALMVDTWVLPRRAVLAAALVIKPTTLCRLAEGCLNLVLSILLTWRLGLVGVALSTAVAGVLASGWYLPRLVSRMFAQEGIISPPGIRLAEFGLTLAGVSVVARNLIGSSDGYGAATLAMATAASCSVLLLWRRVFSDDLRQAARATLMQAGGLRVRRRGAGCQPSALSVKLSDAPSLRPTQAQSSPRG